MGDAAKPCFFKRNKERGIIEDDFRRASPQPDYLIMDDSGNGHSSKTEKGLPPKKGTPGNYGNSPRKGPHAVSSSPNVPKNVGHNPGARTNDGHKDHISKRWLSDELNETDNWLDFKTGSRIPVTNRPRKELFQEGEDGHRWQDGRGCRSVRWQLQKDLTNIDISEMQTGGAENKKPKKPRKSRRTRKEEHNQEEDADGPVIDESALSVKELLGLRQAEERLKRDCVDRLRKRSRNYPTAKYVCRLCDVLVDSIASAHKHIKEKRHKKNIKEKHEEELLTTLPPPTPSQIKAIGVAIDKVVEEFGLNNEDLEQRLEIKQTMEKLFHPKLPDCSLRLYGSSYSRFGFKNSDLNIDVQFPATMTQPDVLLLIQENLKNSESFIDIDADFHARVPVVVCREKQSGLICKVSAGNENACLTTNHLAALGKLEPKLVPLVIAFRYWAKLCCTDHPEEGGLPPYVFALMAIFFLQQRKEPVLPVYLGSWIEGFSLNKLVNFNLKEVENDLVVWEQITSARDDESSKETSFKRGKVPLAFDLENQCSAPVGQLWVELLRFYALEFNLGDLVISIRAKEALSREAKDWPKKRIAVEDPYSVKRNVARTLNSQLVYEYILHCLRATYKYFAIPHKRATKTTPKKPLNINVDASQPSKRLKDDVKHDPEVQVINNKIMVLGDHIDAANTVENFKTPQRNTRKMFDGFESPTEELGDVQVGINQGDLDCIIEEVIFEDSEDLKPHCEEAESGNDEEEEEEEEEPDMRQDWEKSLTTMDQELDDDSENGEVLAHTNDLDMETDSISDLESFQNITITERDDFVTVDDKADMDEESTEGTDELEDSNRAAHSVQGQTSEITNSDDEEEDEEEATNERNSVTVQDGLGTYTRYGDEDVLSEDDGLVVPVKYEDLKEVRKNVDEPLLMELNEKHPLKEENVCEEDSTVDHLDLFYEFSKPVFTKGKPPTVVCSLCKREGHLKKDCPEDFKKIELDPLPPLTPRFSNILDQVCIQCYKDFSATALEDQAREHIRQNLESFIKQEFPGTKLSLFGSSKNGFGFKQSDLDICMTIDGLETAEEYKEKIKQFKELKRKKLNKSISLQNHTVSELKCIWEFLKGLDCIRMIEELSRVLKKHSGLRNVLPITTAKVPIVKFFHVRSGLEVDISLYNTLALHNTKLLAAYSSIDPRVKYLCYTMKVFTKMCDIGDASRGSLSSYAYTLMVLYFLQQRDPPVIPVLQEIYEEEKKPEIIVDGWNTYFFNRISELPAFWPEHGKNTESVGELWLGLLRFYTEEFDFKEHVICIRRKSLLTTFKKQWTSKYIVIEDPFDLNHNLGAGLSRKMTNFIMKAFINGRRVFGIPVKGFPKEYPSKMEYFFDPEVLTEGELAPNDRCCRICGKIGHFMKDCPMRRKVRRRHDHEDVKNQRYPENNEKRNKEDKEIQNKNTERETSVREGKSQCAPQKVKQGRGMGLEAGRDRVPRQLLEKWKRQEDKDLREKRCFICGREGHIKKDCPQYKGATGVSKSDGLFGSSSPGPLKQTGKLSQATHLHEEKKKQKAKIFLSPQSGSLSNKYMTQGKASQKRTHQDS